jgi:aminopeptidase N
VLNGRELDPDTLRGNRLPLPGLREANELRVEADMAYSRDGAGLHRFTDAADGETYLALHAGLDNAQRVFAAFDQPDLKAPITASIVAPGSWTVLGNGVARPAGPAGPPDCLRWALAATPPISSYLFTLVAGPYYSVRASTAASRSACTAGGRWPGPWTGTRRRSSPSPGPASTATWRSSPSPTLLTPTTRRSFPSSRPAR